MAAAAHLGPRLEQRAANLAAGRGARSLDDLGDLLAVRRGRVDPLLGLHDAARRDELHGARDLLGRLDRLDASSKDALLATGHLEARPPTPSPASCRTSASPNAVGIGGERIGDRRRRRPRHGELVLERRRPRHAAPSGSVPFVRISSSRSRVAGAEELEQLGLEPLHVGDRQVVEVAAGAGEDDDDLLLDRHRRVEVLLQQLGEAVAALELGLRHRVELGAEGGERLELTELGEVELERARPPTSWP